MTERQQSAMVRATNAMVRALGGTTVILRIPGVGTAGTERELGMVPAMHQEVELSPVIVRSLEPKDGHERVQVLVPVVALESVRGPMARRELLECALAIVFGGQVFQITDVSAESFGGVEYMWRIAAGR